jgi:hypothetical protein
MFFVLVITIQFNKQRARPDAAQDDLLSTFVSPQTTANEIGFRFVFERKFSLEMNFIKKIFFSDETYTENVLEKQADLIRYLRERNEHLTRLVHQFQHV